MHPDKRFKISSLWMSLKRFFLLSQKRSRPAVCYIYRDRLAGAFDRRGYGYAGGLGFWGTLG